MTARRKLTQSERVQRLRRYLRRRDGNLCCWCHEPMLFGLKRAEGEKPNPEMATLEHIIPKAGGGAKWDAANLALAHQRCNTTRVGSARPKLKELAHASL